MSLLFGVLWQALRGAISLIQWFENRGLLLKSADPQNPKMLLYLFPTTLGGKFLCESQLRRRLYYLWEVRCLSLLHLCWCLDASAKVVFWEQSVIADIVLIQLCAARLALTSWMPSTPPTTARTLLRYKNSSSRSSVLAAVQVWCLEPFSQRRCVCQRTRLTKKQNLAVFTFWNAITLILSHFRLEDGLVSLISKDLNTKFGTQTNDCNLFAPLFEALIPVVFVHCISRPSLARILS